MKIATRRFSADYGGETVVIEKGERVDDGHELVRDYPDCWRAFELADELRVRSDRVAELQRDQREGATREWRPMTEAGRRAEEEVRFWQRVDRLLDDGVPAAERAEQAVFDQGLEQFERVEARAREDDVDLLLEGWQGRLG